MKKAIIIFVIVIASLAIFIVTASLILSHYQTKSFHKAVVEYINKEFDGKVTFRDFSLSYLRHFPRVQINLKDIRMKDNDKEVLVIQDLDAMLNLFGLWNKEIKVEKLVIRGATFTSEIDNLGHSASLLKPKTQSGDSMKTAIFMDLRKIDIHDGHLKFINDIKRNRTFIKIDDSQLRLITSDSMIVVTGKLEGQLDSLISNNSVLFANQPVKASNITFSINRVTGLKELVEGTIMAHSLTLTPRLTLRPGDGGNLIDFQISGEDNFDEFLGLFQFHLGLDIKQTNPEAKLKLDYKQSGLVNDSIRPYSELIFSISDAVFTGDYLPYPLELKIASGNYNNGEEHSPKTVELQIDTIRAEMKQSYVEGHFLMTNLKDPYVKARLVSSLDLHNLIKATEELNIIGYLDLELSVDGKISELRKMNLQGKQSAVGKMTIRDLSFEHKKLGLSIQLESGTTILDNHLIEITSVFGAFNQSAFHFSGLVENLDKLLLKEDENLSANFILNFDVLDLNQIKLLTNQSDSSNSGFSLPYKSYNIGLEIKGNKLKTDYGDFSNISINCALNDTSITISSLKSDFQKGFLSGSGYMNFTNEGIKKMSAQLSGDFDQLDILLPESGMPKPPPTGKKLVIPDYAEGRLNLNIKSGTVDNIPFNNFALSANFKGQEIKVDHLALDALGARADINGGFMVDMNGVSGLKVKGSIAFDKMEIDKMTEKLHLDQGNGKGAGNKSIPDVDQIDLELKANTVVYKDARISNFDTRLLITSNSLEARTFRCELPFGRLSGQIKVQDYSTDKVSYHGMVDLSVDSLNLDTLLAMKVLKSNNKSPEAKTFKKEDSKPSLPDNTYLKVDINAGKLTYQNISVRDVNLKVTTNGNIYNLDTLDMKFADGDITLNGYLKGNLNANPQGYIYLNINNLDFSSVLHTFNNFNQDKFTSENSSGRFSSISHHYFSLNDDLSFRMDDNLWLADITIHHAEFIHVEPIEKTLFFVGHKARDTMMVSELNTNAVLVGKQFYITDLKMNDNIADLEVYGLVDVKERELEMAAEISLSDLFFKSKKERKVETEEGTIDLDTGRMIHLKLTGPLTDHKLNLVSKNKYEIYREDMMEEISNARDEFRNRSGQFPQK